MYANLINNISNGYFKHICTYFSQEDKLFKKLNSYRNIVDTAQYLSKKGVLSILFEILSDLCTTKFAELESKINRRHGI